MENKGLIMRVTIMPRGREMEGVEYFPDPSALFDGSRRSEEEPGEVKTPSKTREPKKDKPLTQKEAKTVIRMHFEDRMGIPRIAQKIKRGRQAITDVINEEKKRRGAG